MKKKSNGHHADDGTMKLIVNGRELPYPALRLVLLAFMAWIFGGLTFSWPALTFFLTSVLIVWIVTWAYFFVKNYGDDR